MKVKRYAMLPVEVLWEYREFKRDEKPAPCIPFFHSYTIDQVAEYITLNGIEPVELSLIGDRALLTDGNHRIVAARNLGYELVPVVVTVFFGETSEIFYKHTLDRFKPLTKAFEFEMKKLFLGTKLYENASEQIVIST